MFLALALILDSGLFAAAASQRTGDSFADHSYSILSPGSRVTLDALESATSNDTSIANLEKLIQGDLLQYDVREVLLDIGWQNFTVGHVPYEQWVDNWLSASDALGIKNLLYVSPLTASAIDSPWALSAIRDDPSAQTYYSNGTAAPYFSPADPDVTRMVESDLTTIYSYYGSHTSLVGLSTGSSNEDPYYDGETSISLPSLGYSNYTVDSFVNSVYFSAGANGSLGTDLLWRSLKDLEPTPSLYSGSVEQSDSNAVYGNGTDAHSLDLRFYLKSYEGQLLIRFYGAEAGSPGDLVGALYGDVNGTEAPSPISAQTIPPSLIGSETSWQVPLTFSGNFTSGFYWLDLSSPSSNSTNDYLVYTEAYQSGNATSQYVLPSGYRVTGSTVLWVQSDKGSTLSVYPYQQVGSIAKSSQEFEAEETFDFNTVLLFVSNRPYDPTNATLSVVDSATNRTVASGLLSQESIHGVVGWVPVQLNASVTAAAGAQYEIQLSSAKSWLNSLEGLTVEPTSAGFQGQGSFWLFQLAELYFPQSHLDYETLSPAGTGDLVQGTEVALRFSPQTNETLERVDVLMSNPETSNSTYTQGDLAISLWTSSLNGSRPSTQVSRVTLPADLVPENGWLNASGLSAHVVGGTQYWIVLSTNSTQGFSLARLANPYNSPVLTKTGNGTTWTSPSSPIDLSTIITLSGQTLENAVQAIPQVALDRSSLYAQPFVASGNVEVQGLYLGGLARGQSGSAGELQVSLRPDDGEGAPSGLVLASGAISASNMTVLSNEYVQFNSIARLAAGTLYWIVVEPLSGSFDVYPVVYANSGAPSNGAPVALLSDNSGSSWRNLYNQTGMLSFALGSPVTPLLAINSTSIYSDLSRNFDSNASSIPLDGWNAYIQTSELTTMHNITLWFDNSTGNSWEFYASVNLVGFKSLGYSDIVPLGPAGTTCSSLAAAATESVPLGESPLPSLGQGLFPPLCGPALSQFTDLSGYMYSTGPVFGVSSPVRVLVIGGPASFNLTIYLRNAFNASFLNYPTDPGLSTVKHLGDYNVVVWATNSSVPESDLSELKAYVLGGGTLLLLGSPSLAFSGLVGFDWLSPPSQNQSASSQSVISAFDDFVAHTQFANGLHASSISKNSSLAVGNGILMGLNAVGQGHVYLLHFSSEAYQQVSDSFETVSNAVFYQTEGGGSPFWYAPQSSSPGLVYGIYGLPGRTTLIWFSNPTSGTAKVSLSLNGTYYETTGDWRLFYLSSLQLFGGRGDTVTVNATVAPESWEPIYVASNGGSAVVYYSSVRVQNELSYPSQSLLYLDGVADQSALVVAHTSNQVAKVIVDDANSLGQARSVFALQNATSGWFQDSNSDTLYIKYFATGNDSVRVLYVSPSPVQTSSPPDSIIVLGLITFVAVELVYLSTSYVKSHRGSEVNPSDR